MPQDQRTKKGDSIDWSRAETHPDNTWPEPKSAGTSAGEIPVYGLALGDAEW
jgi:hypothetical protein